MDAIAIVLIVMIQDVTDAVIAEIMIVVIATRMDVVVPT
jgi:hypothetical protein